MNNTRITKHVEFCAAHSIKGAGKCENKHGHNWEATITVALIGGELDSRGFICDVQDLKHAAFRYDHDDLDKYFAYASTEHVAQKIADDALEACLITNPSGTFIVDVHLVETRHNSAHASATNFVANLSAPAGQGFNLESMKKQALDAEAAWGVGVNQPKAKFIKRSR